MASPQQAFNLALSQAKVSIERAFGILKGRWRILLGKVSWEPSFAADLVIACTVLHNICQERNELEESVLDPYNEANDGDHLNCNSIVSEREGGRIRDYLVDYISETELNNSTLSL